MRGALKLYRLTKSSHPYEITENDGFAIEKQLFIYFKKFALVKK